MSGRRKIRHHSDPRKLGGRIIDPTDDPHAVGSVIVDARHAIHLESMNVSTIDPERGARGQESVIAMELTGRINQTQDRASVLFIFGTDGAAAVITELLGLLGRAGVDRAALVADIEERLARLHADIEERLARLHEEGNLK